MRHLGVLLLAGLILAGGRMKLAYAYDLDDSLSGQRVDSRYCTVYLEPGIDAKKVNRKISVRGIGWQKLPKGLSPEGELAAKCDILFQRAEELLDMYPPGVHVALKITESRDTISGIHQTHYGEGTEAIAIYLFPGNTIYAWAKEVSEAVLIHEMAHCILDHYFQVRPPRKIEELLAIHVDTQMRE